MSIITILLFTLSIFSGYLLLKNNFAKGIKYQHEGLASDIYFALAKKDNIYGFNVFLGGKNTQIAQDADIFLEKEANSSTSFLSSRKWVVDKLIV